MKLQISGILPLIHSPNEIGVKIHCPEPIPDGYHQEGSPVGGKEMWRYMLNAAAFRLKDVHHLEQISITFHGREIQMIIPGTRIIPNELIAILRTNDRFEFLPEEASAAQAA